ncbi:phosphoglycerate kinase-like isoform X3 [Lolium rigidum]|uniref:phosphoglycerate kinase-like isoform X3 n=1 Tax=Lolium rigidum TaxID=89674 RepID=UPI001F5E0C99|nr:phosphoglycerate kinase-like isoform X3 [Lolium rigidum]
MQVWGAQLTSPTPLRREPWPLFGGCSESTRDSCCFLGSQKPLCKAQCSQVSHSSSTTDAAHLQKEDMNSCVDRPTSYLHVQTLRDFPVEKLFGEVVLVRLDSVILLDPLGSCNLSLKRTLSTIKYLYKAGAKVLLVTSWDPVLQSVMPVLNSTESLADYLSPLLQAKVIPVNGVPCLTSFKKEEWVQNDIILFENLLNFRGENANCINFSQKLASGAAVFVNDSFSMSHKIRASTVGITRFCYASLAGFQFEEELMQLLKMTDTTRRPYIAIIGGSNFLRKATALHLLASHCDGLFLVGKLSFQIMNGLGIPVPSCLLERNATKEVLQLIQIAHNRNIPIYYPTDFWCLNSNNNETLEIFDSAELLSGLSALGWTPVDIGPSTLETISSLMPSYKKILWIGPTSYDATKEVSVGAIQLGQILDKASHNSCDVILVGSAACKAVKGISDSSSQYTTFENGSIVWEFLKGRILPGIAALDKSYPYKISWDDVFSDPEQPLFVDIGSGNGLFLYQMARNWDGSNFLGLEMNEKLVIRCLQEVASAGKRNLYFLSTNATSTFRSIISSYPGQLTLVTIQLLSFLCSAQILTSTKSKIGGKWYEECSSKLLPIFFRSMGRFTYSLMWSPSCSE